MSLPKILLIGAGAFGIHYVRLLSRLNGTEVDFSGVILHSGKSRNRIEQISSVPISLRLTDAHLTEADMVIIASPPRSHFELVKKSLHTAHVLCEKPLALTSGEAEELERLAADKKKVLMVGHIYRFHPVVKKIGDMTSEIPERVEGAFINPVSSDPGLPISVEMLHWYDVMDYLYRAPLASGNSSTRDRVQTVHLQYKNRMTCQFRLGYRGEEKERTLRFIYPTREMLCDLAAGSIEVTTDGKKELFSVPVEPEPLLEELRTFLRATKGGAYPSAAVAVRVLQTIESVQ